MPDFDKIAQALTGREPQAVAEALRAAYDAGLEAAAAPFDVREREQFAKAGAAINNTDMQLRSGAALRAQHEARKIRALKLADAASSGQPTGAARTY